MTIKNVLMIAVIAYASVWAIDKGLAMAGLGKFAVNSPG